MADTVNTIYAQQYGANIMQLAQQKYSKLMNTVYLKSGVKGKTFFQDQIGEWTMSAKAGRNPVTPQSDPNLSRRMGVMLDYNDAVQLDRSDELKIISNPKSSYTVAAAASIGRKYDDIIIAAATGTAYSGEAGGTSNTFPTDQTVAAASAGLTLAKVATAKRILDDNDVETEERYFIVSPQGLEDLLNVEQATSADYNAVKALVRGEIDTWLGFKWIMSTRLTLASTTRSCLAFQKYGLCLGTAESAYVRTDERADLSYSWQIYYEISCGAVRLEEDRVVKVNIIES